MPARVAYQDDRAVAFHDLAPQAPVHVLVVPRRHVANLAATGEDDEPLLGHLLGVARRLGQELECGQGGYRVVFNVGRHGGQSVDHLHVHLLGGRPMSWPPG